MDILILSIIAGLLCVAGLFLASRGTQSPDGKDKHNHA